MVQQTEHDGDSGELGKAVHDLEQAESRLANAHVEEAAAEHDIAQAIEEIKDAEHGCEVEVHVIHVNALESRKGLL